MAEHSPTPWEVCPDGNDYDVIYPTTKKVTACCFTHEGDDEGNAPGYIFCDKPIAKANAEFIVRACNCHDELLAACRGVMAVCESPDHWQGDTQSMLLLVQAAIAKAEEK